MTNNLETIQNRIAQIKQELSELGPMRPGSVCRQFRDKEKQQGEYYQLSYTWRGKSRTRHVRPEEMSIVENQTAAYKRFKSLMNEWIELSLLQCEIMQETQRRGIEE